jgi:hypothetical protein
LGSQLSEE